MNDDFPQAPFEWLQHLHLAGQWTRLEHFAGGLTFFAVG
jgi:hypothetical protein